MNLQLKKAGVSALFVPLMVIGASVLPPAVAAQTGNAAAVRGLPDFTDLVDQVGPSVVNIRTMERVRSGGSASAGDEEMQEFFRRFFGMPMPNAPRQSPRPNRPAPQTEQEVPRGVGSGFILSAD